MKVVTREGSKSVIGKILLHDARTSKGFWSNYGHLMGKEALLCVQNLLHQGYFRRHRPCLKEA